MKGSTGKKAVVIGSGFGGLAAAVRLAARGYQVTVCERLDGPGGRAYVYRQDGFTFDAGPTIITAPFLLEELWSLCGRKMSDDIDLIELSPYYRIRFDDGTHFDYSGDHEAMKAEIAKFSPNDVDGYERFLEASKLLYTVGFDQLLHVSFDSFGKMLRVLPDLLRAQFYRSVYSLVSKYIKNPKLRRVFSFHPLLVGGNPFTTTAVYALIAQLERKQVFQNHPLFKICALTIPAKYINANKILTPDMISIHNSSIIKFIYHKVYPLYNAISGLISSNGKLTSDKCTCGEK